MNLDAMLKIDHDALDVEWLQQPSHFMMVSREVANLKRDLSSAKEQLDLAEAELANRIRRRPAKYGLDERVTEGAIKAIVATDETVKQKRKELIDIQHELDVTMAAVRAMEHRKQALEELVRLHGQQYFAGPKDPRDLNLEAAKKGLQQEAREKIKNRRTK